MNIPRSQGYYDKKVKPQEPALQEVIHKDVDNSVAENPSTANPAKKKEKIASENLSTVTPCAENPTVPCAGNPIEKVAKKTTVSENLSTVKMRTVNMPQPNNTCTNILNK